MFLVQIKNNSPEDRTSPCSDLFLIPSCTTHDSNLRHTSLHRRVSSFTDSSTSYKVSLPFRDLKSLDPTVLPSVPLVSVPSFSSSRFRPSVYRYPMRSSNVPKSDCSGVTSTPHLTSLTLSTVQNTVPRVQNRVSVILRTLV